jgi:hypothetical protein
MKHILKLQVEMEFDHADPTMSGSVKGADFYRAKQLAMTTIPMKQGSDVIESVLFGNQENFQTRVLALYIAGLIRGQAGPPTIAIGIIHKDPPKL